MKTKIKAPKGWRVLGPLEKPHAQLLDLVVLNDGTERPTRKTGESTVEKILNDERDISHYIRRIKKGKKK